MESRILSTLILVCLSLYLKSAVAKCPKTWTHFGHSCYKFVAQKTSWYNAKDICETAKSHMIHISSKAEDKFAVSLARKNGATVWIGLNDLMQEGSYVWYHNQKEPSYTHWAPNQPNSLRGNEDCIQLAKYENYLWNDANCEHKFSTICEKRAKKIQDFKV